MTTNRRAAIYARISEDREGVEVGVTAQVEDCTALAATLGLEVVQVYRENDTGASTRSRKARPKYAAMLAAARAGEFGHILGYSNSRLTRRPRELEDFIELFERVGVVAHTVVSGNDDLSTADGRMTARIKVSVDAAEAERIGERVKRRALTRAQEGRPNGGPRPFGYEPGGVGVRETEAAAVREGYAALLAGASLASIQRSWNSAGLHTGRTGSPWTVAGVRECLRNARYAGLRTHKGEVVGPAAWDALVPEETWRAARELLDDPARRVGSHSAQKLLTGVARCGVCDGPVHASGSGRAKPVYRCATVTGHFARQAAPIEEFVAAVVVERLSRVDAAELLVDDNRLDAAALRAEAGALRVRLDTLAVEFADGALTASQLRAATERLRGQLAAVEAQQADAGRVSALGPVVGAEDARAAWQRLDTDRQRAIVDALMVVRILPVGRGTRGFDPTSVELDWRA